MRRSAAGEVVYRRDMRTQVEDPYRRTRKYPAGTRCRKCGLVYEKGSWKHARSPDETHRGGQLCPACRQTRDGYPGGVVKLGGRYIVQHRRDVLNRVRNVAKQVEARHPLERLIGIDDRGAEIVVYSATEHLAARIGKALQRSFKGELDLAYGSPDKRARVRWLRHA